MDDSVGVDIADILEITRIQRNSAQDITAINQALVNQLKKERKELQEKVNQLQQQLVELMPKEGTASVDATNG